MEKLNSDLKKIAPGVIDRGKEAKTIKTLSEEKRKNLRILATKERNKIMSEMMLLRLSLSETKGQLKEIRKNEKKQRKLSLKLTALASDFRKENDDTAAGFKEKIERLGMSMKRTELELVEARNEIDSLVIYKDNLGKDFKEMKFEYSATVDDLVDKLEQEQMKRSKDTIDLVEQMNDARERAMKVNVQIQKDTDEAIRYRDGIISSYEAERASLRKLTKQSFVVIKGKISGIFKK